MSPIAIASIVGPPSIVGAQRTTRRQRLARLYSIVVQARHPAELGSGWSDVGSARAMTPWEIVQWAMAERRLAGAIISYGRYDT